jgi:hypothetical protein
MQSARRDESGWPADGVWRGPKPGTEYRVCLNEWIAPDGRKFVCYDEYAHLGKCLFELERRGWRIKVREKA